MTSKQEQIEGVWWKSDTARRVLACLVCGLLSASLWWMPVVGVALRKLMRETQDHHARADIRLEAREDMVLLGIDADSLALDSLPQGEVDGSPVLSGMQAGWPWSRGVHAAVIGRLLDSGARLVVLDVVLSGSSDEEGDRALAEVIKRYRGRVILASAFVPGEDGGQMRLVEPMDAFLGPLEEETSIGFVNFWPDVKDRLVRRADFQMTSREANGQLAHVDEPVFVSLVSAAANRLGVDVPSERKRFQMALEGKNAGEVYKPLSLHTLFVEEKWRGRYAGGDFFKGKIVFIGPTSPLFQDSHETVGGRIHGVQLHMQVLTAMRADAWYSEGLLGGGVKYAVVLFLLGMGISMVCAFLWSRTVVLFLCGCVCVIAWILLEYFSARLGGVLLGSLAAICTALGGVAGAIVWQAMSERARRQELHRHLQRSMSPDVADAIVRAPEGYYAAASGNRREVTVLFADVRGFTQRSERQDAGELVSQLNEYLGRMVEVIFSHGGTVDKFIGDAIMATWGGLGEGDPVRQSQAASTAAEEMLVSLSVLNAEWEGEGKEAFHIGVGLHQGEAIVGEVGSDQRTDFTVIGDAVNLASRIEGLTKAMGLELLLSSAVVHCLDDADVWTRVGTVRVKGREKGVTLFSKMSVSEEDRKVLVGALRAFRDGDFPAAAQVFVSLQAHGELGGLADFYLNQIKLESQGGGGAPDGWDGVLKMRTK